MTAVAPADDGPADDGPAEDGPPDDAPADDAPRRAGVAHAAALAAIHAAAFAAAERWPATEIATTLAMPGAWGLIAARGGMAIARAAGGEAELLTLGVAPEARRQGLGRALVRAVLTEAAARGAAQLFLEVKADNTAALALYRGAGCVEVGRRRRYYADGNDALVLRAALSAGE